MSDPALLDEADKAFVTAMQQLDADADASAKECVEKFAEIRSAFGSKVIDQINHPAVEDVSGDSGTTGDT
jgi:hypothetical protein